MDRTLPHTTPMDRMPGTLPHTTPNHTPLSVCFHAPFLSLCTNPHTCTLPVHQTTHSMPLLRLLFLLACLCKLRVHTCTLPPTHAPTHTCTHPVHQTTHAPNQTTHPPTHAGELRQLSMMASRFPDFDLQGKEMFLDKVGVSLDFCLDRLSLCMVFLCFCHSSSS